MWPATTVVISLEHPFFTLPGLYSALRGIWVMSTGHLLGVTMGYYSKTRQTEHSSVSLDIKKALSGFLSCIEHTDLAESVEPKCLECPPGSGAPHGAMPCRTNTHCESHGVGPAQITNSSQDSIHPFMQHVPFYQMVHKFLLMKMAIHSSKQTLTG